MTSSPWPRAQLALVAHLPACPPAMQTAAVVGSNMLVQLTGAEACSFLATVFGGFLAGLYSLWPDVREDGDVRNEIRLAQAEQRIDDEFGKVERRLHDHLAACDCKVCVGSALVLYLCLVIPPGSRL